MRFLKLSLLRVPWCIGFYFYHYCTPYSDNQYASFMNKEENKTQQNLAWVQCKCSFKSKLKETDTLQVGIAHIMAHNTNKKTIFIFKN